LFPNIVFCYLNAWNVKQQKLDFSWANSSLVAMSIRISDVTDTFAILKLYIVFTWRHHFLKSKTKEPPVFILIRDIRRYIYICLQFYSSIACFAWKPEHFEVRGYGGAWHKSTIEFVEKYILVLILSLFES